ncbi:MAG: sensor histidine kinase [Lachnospiraceae bacterium]|jgi:signal transduction histidine kinase|nr:sensor histidine kinase [Lachnospiraceae bacterium]
MSDRKDRYIALFQGAMLILNCVAVTSICAFIYVTTRRILAYYDARRFLNGVVTIPNSPRDNLVVCMVLMGILVLTFTVRQFIKDLQNRFAVVTLILDMAVCSAVIFHLDFNYNGLILLVFANVISYVKDGKAKLFFVALAIAGYLVADYELLSIYMPLYNIDDYIRYYASGTQQYLFSVYNIMVSLNIILFIVYCVYVINAQRGTIEEVNHLYRELQTANEQLKEYADMTERMAQTRERNRLAREIHDTLGHTLTGIATGLDACLALIEVSPEQTKKQLLLLSKVSREGILDIRRSVNELRPDALERLSLEVAIRKMVTDMSQVSDVSIYFETDEKHLKFDEDEENAIYRVIQESITNAVRHGKAEKIWITLKRVDGEILLVIKDNGTGAKKMESGFGTRHIRERIEMLKGTVDFDGQHGFTVTAHIPIRWGETYD